MGNTYDTEAARIEANIQTRWRTTTDYRWGYTDDRGPETWWMHYPSASGGNQSPVDIITEDVTTNLEFNANPLQVCYSSGCELTHEDDEELIEAKEVMNTGNTARINVINSRSYITGGPCKQYSYVLEQLHLHWGESDGLGSEHLVNSRSFSAELHLVHWNEDLYNCYEDAVSGDEGILIIAIFLKASDDKCNEGIKRLSHFLDDIAYREHAVPIIGEFDLQAFLPDDLHKYWTYKGSFTTPPCYETVTWLLLEEPCYISGKILENLRKLRSYYEDEIRPGDEFDGLIRNNRRNIQPIGTRKVTYVDSSSIFRLNKQPFRDKTRKLSRPTFQAHVGQSRRHGIHGPGRQ